MSEHRCRKLRERLIEIPKVGESAIFVFYDKHADEFYVFNTNVFLSEDNWKDFDGIVSITYCPFCGSIDSLKKPRSEKGGGEE